MQIESFFQTMSDGFELFVNRWIVDEGSDVKGVVCFCHGMQEHIMRYDRIATYFTEHGYIFNAYDQRGHGKTAQNSIEKNKGDFMILAEKKGFERVTDDLHEILSALKNKYPDKKIILASHSFGSLVTQNYIETYGKTLIDSCVLIGTSGPNPLAPFGLFLNRIFSPFVNKNKGSKFFDKLVFGSYLNHIPKKERLTSSDWLSVNRDNINLFKMDAWCGKLPSFSFFKDLLSLVSKISKKKNIKKIPENLPLLFMYGTEDPVGNYGKSIQYLIFECKKHGVQTVDFKAYVGLRHEILNESEWKAICDDLISWIS